MSFTCNHCSKSFSSLYGLKGHSRTHGPSGGKLPSGINSAVHRRSIENHKNAKELYDQNPKQCLKCNTILPYEKRKINYCDHSCQASYVNTKRTISKSTNINIRMGIIQHFIEKDPMYPEILGPFTRISFSKCRITGKYYK